MTVVDDSEAKEYGKKNNTADTKTTNAGIQFISINERGDKILVLRTKDEGVSLTRLIQDTTKTSEGGKKKFKLDPNTIDTKFLDTHFPMDKNSKSQFKLIPTLNDFIILGRNKTENKVYVFFNEQFVTKVECNLEDLYFNVVENQIKAIYDIKKKEKYSAKDNNYFNYKMWEKESNEWYSVNHEIVNQ